jgi:hypothetical protein
MTKNSRPPHRITCGGCTNTWTGLTYAHCGVCHITLAGIGLFDRHRERDEDGGAHCVYPASVTSAKGEQVMFLREDGVWHGKEMPEGQKAKLRELSKKRTEAASA